MKLPVIQTQHLELVPFREGDVDALHRHWTDPDVRRWLWDDVVIPRERAAETVQWAVDSAAEKGVGMWSLFLRDGDGGLIGFCGFRGLPDLDDIELLYSLYPAYWGRGLATEASRAALEFAFRELRVRASTPAPIRRTPNPSRSWSGWACGSFPKAFLACRGRGIT